MQEGSIYRSQQERNTNVFVVNTTLLLWCLIEEGHTDVNAGQGTIFLGLVLIVAYLNKLKKKRVQEQSATGGDRRVPDCPLDRVSSCMYVLCTRRFHICLFPHADTVDGDVSVNTSGALLLVRIAPYHSYWYAISSHYYTHAIPWVGYCTITIHHYHYYADVVQVEEARTLRNIYYLVLPPTTTTNYTIILSITAGA